MRKRTLALALILLGLLVIGKGYWNATRPPIVRTATLALSDWPAGAAPMRVLLVSDIHISGPDMPPARLVSIAGELNTLKPDLILIAGDLISEKRTATRLYTANEVANALKAFRAPLGVVIVPGNHDHWAGIAPFQAALPRAGLVLLQNDAIRRGPLVIGGVDDDFTGRDDLPKTFAAMDGLGGPHIILSHSPDIVPDLPHPVAAVLAGHTHCGQITNPFSGAPVSSVSRYGVRYNCGALTDKAQSVIVTAGLGTSILPLRYGAPPDAWLLTIGPAERGRP